MCAPHQVLCSVPDASAALAEIKRVVAPGGRLLLIEHVAAPPGRPLVGLGQRVLEPLQRLVADGCARTHAQPRCAFLQPSTPLWGRSVAPVQAPALALTAPTHAAARSCHLTRDTARTLRATGFDAAELEAFEVEGLGILAPHIAGVLTV